MSRVPPAFESEPYRRELEVEIVDHAPTEGEGRPAAVLDDTLLYPEGGGQPADRGRLGDSAVIDVQRIGGRIVHYLTTPVAAGRALLTIDWDRRYDHMQQHTAQHVLTAVAAGSHGWATTAFHLGAEVSSIDLATTTPNDAELEKLERAVLDEIAAARPVTARRVSSEEFERLRAADEVRSRRLPAGHRGDVRLVEIAGLDVNTCGGTHLASTAEIAMVKLLGTEPAHGGCRIFWVAGDRVRRRLAESEGRIAELRRLFETSAAELPSVARLKLDQLRAAERRAGGLEDRLAEAEAARLAAVGAKGFAEVHFDDADGGLLRKVARSFSAAPGAGVALLTATGATGSFFALAAGADCELDLKALGEAVAATLEGRGGGAGQLFQGKAGSLTRRQEAVAAVTMVATTDAPPTPNPGG